MANPRNVFRAFQSFALIIKSVGRLVRGAQSRLRNKSQQLRIWRYDRMLRACLERTRPTPVGTGSQTAHVLTGHSRIHQAIAAAKSLYRFDVALALVIHDEGTLTSEDVRAVQDHLPGARVESVPELGEKWRAIPFALKLFMRGLYFDADVLFHQRPEELLELKPCYNLDWLSRYVLPEEDVRALTGIDIQPTVNAGLFVSHEIEDCEKWLEVLPVGYYTEQTLTALRLTVQNANPLDKRYDVAFLYACGWDETDFWKKMQDPKDVITQHYCGRFESRLLFYPHFIRYIAPTLR
jgi:hypothetical protein